MDSLSTQPVSQISRLLRYLRITWSVGCGFLTILLVLLCVRSYWWVDTVFPAPDYRITVKSQQGQISIGLGRDSWTPPFSYVRMGIDSLMGKLNSQTWTIVNRLTGDTRLVIPHWFLVASIALFVALPWIRWRFSLRSLLIAAPIIAVLLGLIVWAAG